MIYQFKYNIFKGEQNKNNVLFALFIFRIINGLETFNTSRFFKHTYITYFNSVHMHARNTYIRPDSDKYISGIENIAPLMFLVKIYPENMYQAEEGISYAGKYIYSRFRKSYCRISFIAAVSVIFIIVIELALPWSILISTNNKLQDRKEWMWFQFIYLGLIVKGIPEVDLAMSPTGRRTDCLLQRIKVSVESCFDERW